MSDLEVAREGIERACSRLPGRVLRGRWGAIDSVEDWSVNIRALLRLAFGCISAEVKVKKRPSGRGDGRGRGRGR
eukprot:3443961-Pyramimonas_sp.AAC.1